MSPTRSDLITTASALVTSYKTWTASAILSIRSPSCIHHVLPSSRNQPPRNNAEYIAYFSPLLPLFQNFTPTIHEEHTVVDVEARKVIMHLESRADTKIGVYENEYILMVEMTEEGDRVQEVWEFVDSAASSAFFGRLRLATKEAGE